MSDESNLGKVCDKPYKGEESERHELEPQKLKKGIPEPESFSTDDHGTKPSEKDHLKSEEPSEENNPVTEPSGEDNPVTEPSEHIHCNPEPTPGKESKVWSKANLLVCKHMLYLIVTKLNNPVLTKKPYHL